MTYNANPVPELYRSYLQFHLPDRLHFPCVCTVIRPQIMLQRVKNKKYDKNSSGVTVVLYTL